jgi:hypothetical protein
MLLWICRHGIVTVDQIQRRFFSGRRAASRRVRKLADLGFLQLDEWMIRQPHLVRVTRTGARLVTNEISPARVVPSQIRHSLRLVDLVEELAQQNPSATVTTEREVRGRIHRARRAGHPQPRRIPDAVLTFPDRATTAIELDLSWHWDYARIIRAYASENYARVLFVVTTKHRAKLLRRIVNREYADDRITVEVRS